MESRPNSAGTSNALVRDRWWRQILGPKVAPYLFVSPFFILFFVFWLFPVLWSIVLSFQRWHATGSTWVGLANYRFALRTDATRRGFANLVWYAIANNVFQLTIALIISVLLDLPFLRRVSGALRVAYFTPNLVSGVTTGILFAVILGGGGVSDRLLSSVGLEIRWLQSVEWA